MFTFKKKVHIFPFLLLVVSLILATPASAAVVNVKLNSPFTGPGNVESFKIAPDGSRVVYQAAEDTVVELYSVPVDGSSAPTKLNGALPTGGNVSEFEISPDSTQVVYRADQDLNDKFELYSVSLSGGSITKLNNAAMADNRDVSGFRISPDSSRVVYRADEDSNGENELFSVLISGGGKAKLNPNLVNNRDVLSDFEISPDSSRVAYRADQDTDGVVELYSAPIAATGGVKLSSPMGNGGDVLRLQISPDSSRVVYHADQDTDGTRELYSAPIASAGGAVQLNTDPVSGGQVLTGFLISPDSSRVVYRADQDTDTVTELYSVPMAGGSPTKLNDFSAVGILGDVRPGFQISPDSSRVVYIADEAVNEQIEVFSVQLDGTGRVKLSELSGSFDVTVGPLISPDSSRIVYRADANTDEVYELYSAPIATAGSSVKLNNTPVTNGDVAGAISNVPDFLISPDSSQVVYRGDLDTDEVYELYTAPIDAAGGQVKLNSPLASGGDVQPASFLISADSIYVVYRADQDTNDVIELYSSHEIFLSNPGLTKAVDPSTPVIPGQAITYTLTFSNTGEDTATGVVITDVVPNSLTNVSVASSGATIADTGSTPPFVWTVQDLAPNQTGYITITGEIDTALTNSTRFTNTATISATNDISTANNTDEVGVVVFVPDLSVSKTVDDATPVPGQTITYTVSVHNSDTIAGASGVVISDILPGNVTYINSSTSNGSSYDPASGVWNVGDVGASTGVTLNIVVTASSLPGRSITNTAALSASIPPDPNISNNASSAVITMSGEGGRIIYLPLIFKNFTPGPDLTAEPDLVVDDLVATSSAVTVTIRNAGTTPVVDAFWVDVYFNPSATPSLNQRWDTIANHGVVWGVTADIPAGDSLTLVTGGAYYFPEHSSPTPLPVDANVYTLVDSINFATTYGAVQESNEDNNLFGPVKSTVGVTGQASQDPGQGQPVPREGLPLR